MRTFAATPNHRDLREDLTLFGVLLLGGAAGGLVLAIAGLCVLR